MNKKTEMYFTIGEFANLFGVSKQTLFYYERNKIFEPDLVEENGYRYYSLHKYYIFEVIITLRKLGLPLQEISDYVKNRDLDALQAIFKKKLSEFEEEVQILLKNKKNLQTKISRLEQVKQIRIDKITLENVPKEYLIVDDFRKNTVSLKEKIGLVAKHNLPFATSRILNEYLMGYILEKEQLLNNSYTNINKIFTRISEPTEYQNITIKPAGLYATIFTPDCCHANYGKAIKKLKEFIELNKLQIVGEGYISQLRNHWSTANPQEYVAQIALHVDYLD